MVVDMMAQRPSLVASDDEAAFNDRRSPRKRIAT
jgi:hypothetical protein